MQAHSKTEIRGHNCSIQKSCDIS